MRIAPLFLALALILLWWPTALLIGQRRRGKLHASERNAAGAIPGILRSFCSWLDLARASAGSWLLANHAVLPLFSSETAVGQNLRTAVVLSVLFVGALSQTLISGSRRVRLAPLSYLVGIACALLPWQVSTFGIALGITLAGMLRYWFLLFWLLPLSLGAMAALYGQLAVSTLLVPVLFLVPGILGLHPNHPLAWLYDRKPVSSEAVAESITRRVITPSPATAKRK